MSKELDAIIKSCEQQMSAANAALEAGMEPKLNDVIWSEAYKRCNAAYAAKAQQCGMHWTTSGDFSHLQSTPGVNF